MACSHAVRLRGRLVAVVVKIVVVVVVAFVVVVIVIVVCQRLGRRSENSFRIDISNELRVI